MGEGLSHYRELRENSDRLKCIGMTMWGTVNEATRMELKDCSEVNFTFEEELSNDEDF
jgi:Cu/Ag efflux protein CusF